MEIAILNRCGDEGRTAASELVSTLTELGFAARQVETASEIGGETLVELSPEPGPGKVALSGRTTLLERALRALPMDFDRLPLLVEGDSKELRLWTDHVVVERFKPTVYSYTHNRYGEVSGTDRVRIRFTAELFRRMAQLEGDEPDLPRSTFLAEIEAEQGAFLVQRKAEVCNLETRIKRYHIGSPLHRYLYTERYESTQASGPIKRWSALAEPVVCFDWRHPLHDEEGNRLADEPLPDDYAALWMYNTENAKSMARRTFLWMEEMFAKRDLLLVDMCIFIDRHGQVIYGEISPDSMRVRVGLGDPAAAEAADKDVWRAGRSADVVRERYELLYERLFGSEDTV